MVKDSLRKRKFSKKKKKITCKSRVGCRRLSVAVLQSYYDEKEEKKIALNKAKKKLDKMKTESVPKPLYEKQKALVERLEYEFGIFVRFETSPLYDLYFTFLLGVIEKEIVE